MTSYTFRVPKDHTLQNILKFSNELADFSEQADEFIFDFQKAGYNTPFGMLYISFAIRRFQDAHPESICKAINASGNWYAAHMGYFQNCGFDIGKLPGEAKGSDTYLPITIVSIDEIRQEALSVGREIGDVVEARSKKLACVLTQQENGPLADMLTYAFREMIRNVVEHSKSTFVAYCAQYQPSKKMAEIGILDSGIGIRTSLSKNPFLKIQNDREALNLALMPGISGKVYKGIRQNPNDAWQNSGFGLFVVSRLCGHEGKFLICSGDTALNLKPDGKRHLPVNFRGTAIRLNLSSKNLEDLPSKLAAIVKDGDEQAKAFKGSTGIEPSVASRMLTSEFRNSDTKEGK